jgi:hypothetical protein
VTFERESPRLSRRGLVGSLPKGLLDFLGEREGVGGAGEGVGEGLGELGGGHFCS